jgi:hypothetical protein
MCPYKKVPGTELFKKKCITCKFREPIMLENFCYECKSKRL